MLTITILPEVELPGTLTLKSNGLTFKPSRNFSGEVTVQYTVDDVMAPRPPTIVLRNGLHYAASYRALPPVTGAHVGAVDVTVAGTEVPRVWMTSDGVRFPFSGILQQTGEDTVGLRATSRRRNLPDRTLELSWAPDRTLTAELMEGDQILYTAQGRRAFPSPLTAANVYTLQAMHSNISGNAAGRVTGCAFLKVPLDGRATFRGRLGDGTPFVTKGARRVECKKRSQSSKFLGT